MSAASPLDRDDPRRIGGYRLVGRLGTGGQGVVYLAQAPDGRGVAVKVLHARLSRDPQARRRLLREIEALRRVRQFCTARVLDVDTSGDRPYVLTSFPVRNAGNSFHTAHAALRGVPVSWACATTSDGLTSPPQAFRLSARPAARRLHAAFTSRS